MQEEKLLITQKKIQLLLRPFDSLFRLFSGVGEGGRVSLNMGCVSMYCEWHLDVRFAISYHHSDASIMSEFSPTNQNRVSQTVIHACLPMRSS